MVHTTSGTSAFAILVILNFRPRRVSDDAEIRFLFSSEPQSMRHVADKLNADLWHCLLIPVATGTKPHEPPHIMLISNRVQVGRKACPGCAAVRAWVARLMTINSWLGCCAARSDTGSRGHTQLALLPRLALSRAPLSCPRPASPFSSFFFSSFLFLFLTV